MKLSLALLLLAATPMMAQVPQISPPAPVVKDAARQDQPQSEILIQVKSDGTLIVEKQAVTRKELTERLSTLSKLHKNQPLRLRGEADCPYQPLVEVIDLCQQAGIWNISFATQRPQPSE